MEKNVHLYQNLEMNKIDKMLMFSAQKHSASLWLSDKTWPCIFWELQ